MTSISISPDTVIANTSAFSDEDLCIALDKLSLFLNGKPKNVSAIERSSLFWVHLKFLMQNRLSRKLVAEKFLTIVKYLCRSGPSIQCANNANIRQLGSIGACFCVTEIMALYIADAELTLNACVAIQYLTGGDDVNRAEFGSLGACAAIINSFALHIRHVEVAEKSCVAIGNLAFNDVNCIQFGKAGACELILEAMKLHMHHVGVIEEGCFAIGKLAYKNDSNCTLLQQQDVCETIVASLQMHFQNSSVAEEGCCTIGTLAAHSMSNRERLRLAGACEIVLSTIELHIHDQDVSQWAMAAIGNLACDEINRGILGSLGACILSSKVLPLARGQVALAEYASVCIDARLSRHAAHSTQRPETHAQ